MEAPVDGFTLLRVIDETSTVLHAVGISYVLPSSQLPIDAEFKLTGDKIHYRILVGVDGGRWDALTASMRWKHVYNYAADGAEPTWDWERPVVGTLDILAGAAE